MSGDKSLDGYSITDLRKMAKEEYGLAVSATMSKADVIDAIEKERGITSGKAAVTAAGKTVLGKFFPKDNDPDFNIIDIIHITEDPDNNDPVFIAVNNRAITVPRGSDQPVRRPHVLALKNAVEEHVNRETSKITSKLRHPFQVIQYDVS